MFRQKDKDVGRTCFYSLSYEYDKLNVIKRFHELVEIKKIKPRCNSLTYPKDKSDDSHLLCKKQ